MPTVSVGATLAAAFNFIGVGWSRAWGIMLLIVWASAMFQAVVAVRPDLAWIGLIAWIPLLAISNASIGALYRTGLEADHPGDPNFRVGPAGFAWGGLEWRVLGANVVVFLIWFVLALFAFILIAIVFGVAGVMSGASDSDYQAMTRAMLGPAGLVTLIIAIPSAVGLTLLAAKMALFAVTAADAGKFEFGRAWSLTRGALAAIIVTMLVILVGEFVLGILVGAIIGLFAVAAGPGSQAAGWGQIVGQAMGAALNAPLVSGMQLYVYRTQRGPAGLAQTFA